jgi:antitoxin MazE
MKKEIDLINIGNSKGVRLPKQIIEACGFGDTILLEFDDGKLTLSPKKKVREGWAEIFDKEIKREPKLKEEFFNNKFDEKDWTW